MVKARLEYNIREFLVGHRRTTGLDRHYDRTPVEDRLQEYMKAMDLLTISPENRLRKQVAEQEHTIQVQLAESEKERCKMAERIDNLEALLADPEQYIRMRNLLWALRRKSDHASLFISSKGSIVTIIGLVYFRLYKTMVQ
jgi:hypothetical protein